MQRQHSAHNLLHSAAKKNNQNRHNLIIQVA